MSGNRIAVIDYGMGNLRSVEKALQKVGADVVISSKYQALESADKIVLPGVGAFPEGMKNLKKLDLVSPLNDIVVGKGKFFLGICLGMQLLSAKSYEIEETKGLNWVGGEIRKFKEENIKIPHVGWNNICFSNQNPLFKGIPNHTDFYFVHSYYLNPDNDFATSVTTHGVDFAASVKKHNILGCQFHPEKSQHFGLELLSNFVKLKK